MGRTLPHVVEDCHGLLKLYSDGSVFRSKDVLMHVPSPVHDDSSVVWKDTLLDDARGLHLRIYRPRSPAPSANALPVVFFFHGGGFCFGSRTWPNSHATCVRLCFGLRAVVLAPDYRLAPEHRLPAAADDAFRAVKWLASQAWARGREGVLGDGVDFGRVFVVGDSSGGNLAHHLAVRLRAGSQELAPVRVRGYVMLSPFFGGTVRTKSEAEGPPEPSLNIQILDRFWRLALPTGQNTDHPMANPFGPESPSLERVRLDPILVMVGGKEIVKDRVENYVMKMKSLKKEVDYVVFQGEYHGFFINDPFSDVGDLVVQKIMDFMSKV
ncbi:unnamed protein product [Cuscuta campestris]|uniref:Alpha/beta hydrolase fold-3 domain-containing protein n=1 Tax=Cuscuta campestris TaxID=132261 RepID=A0A484K649_9ASTE|nr:unnamed protein product [Cuscuta campestris]